MVDAPLVSVLMSVYNGDEYVGEAVESILTQTLRDFEFIIINDGSTDCTAEILADYERRDERVHVYHQENRGLASALNKGLELSRGKYIARMDADDISRPERLEKQVAFMEAHPETGVCGTWFETSDGKVLRHPIEDAAIRSNLIFDTALAHPTVMMRRALFLQMGLRYPAYRYAQDFALWAQLANQTQTSFANLSEVLVYIRSHPQRVAWKHRTEQMEWAGRVRFTQLQCLGLTPTAEEIELHQAISEWRFQSNKRFVTQCDRWLRRIASANQQRCIYPEPEFARVLSQRWFAVCSSATGLGLWVWSAFWKSPLRATGDLSLRSQVKLTARCAIAHIRSGLRRTALRTAYRKLRNNR